MNRYVIGWWNGDSTCMSTWKGSLRQQVVEVVPNSCCKARLRRLNRIIVAPFSREEPTKASRYSSVTTDVHYICTVTAIPPPAPLQLCHCIRDREESCQVSPWTSGRKSLLKTRSTSHPRQEYCKLFKKADEAVHRRVHGSRLASSRTALFKTPCVKGGTHPGFIRHCATLPGRNLLKTTDPFPEQAKEGGLHLLEAFEKVTVIVLVLLSASVWRAAWRPPGMGR